MNKRIIDEFPLCKEMMEDLRNKYQVDKFWKGYESRNVTLIKHYGLKNFRHRPNSYGGISSIKSIIPGGILLDRIINKLLSGLDKYLGIDWLRFPLLDVFNYTVDAPKEIRGNYSSLILEMINLLPDADKLLNIRDDLVGNPSDILKLRENKYSLQFINYFYRLLVINQFVDFKESNLFLEIGGGYGGFSEVLKKTYPNVKIIFIDIAPQLYVAESYLKSVFPDRVAGYRDTKQMKSISYDAFSSYDILILPPWDIEKIEDNLIDNFSNQSSFQEMSQDTVRGYCKQLGRIIKSKVVLYEQREGNGAVKDSVKRDDYLRYMGSNGFKLINEKLAGYGGHLRSDPSAPLCHQDFYFFQKNKTM